ncbi:ChrR family anti-sigma-E factor [Motiliproteus sp. SC1-56]|uniref:ChrR family anti-sigma-E factor n=1 Tax=Motiliproteus sp. SC1-56 TaxID=2799565 RepID=UPI001A8C23B9|nr:ChrR family anti-sigma-E factor [Motiliproteus sp. SC1-56]
MNMLFHPDDATLASYAACGVERNYSIVLDLHIRECRHCQQRISDADHIGGALLQALPAAPLGQEQKAAVMALLDGIAPAPGVKAPAPAPEEMPKILEVLRNWRQADLDALPWKPMAPGIRRIPIEVPQGRLNLLRIAPGTCLPVHSHQGNELTMVLRGSFSDEIGRFTPGNVADLDDDVEHQPIADRDEDCICLVATDAPLRFRDWLPQLLQPLFRL